MQEAAKYPGVWYLDTGCSRHVTGDASLLSNLIPYDGPRVTFGGSNDFGLTKGLGNLVYKGLTIQAVSYVEGLNYNLLSISQFCDKGYSLEFCKDMASLKNISTNEVILSGKRIRNIYEVMWDNVKEACLISKSDTNLLWLWNKRLSHLNFKTLNKLSKEGLVEGLPKAVFRNESICDACQKGKQVNSNFKAKPAPSTTRILSLLHMDLFGPVTPISLSGMKYVLVVVDDYSRYTWTIFLNSKKETQGKLTNCMKLIQNQASQTIQKIRFDKGTEFLNETIIHYYEKHVVDKPSKHDHEVLDLSNKDEEVNEGDRMKPTESIPFRSLPLKTSQRNPDSDSAEPTGNFGQPFNIPDHSNSDNSGNGDPVPIHPETPTTSVLQPEAELDQPVNLNQHNLRWLRDHPPQYIIGDIHYGVRTRSAQQNLEAMLAYSSDLLTQISERMKIVGANVHFQKLEAKCSSPAFYQSYLEMIAAQELSEFLHMEIHLKYEEEVLEFYKNGEVKTVHSKKDPQRMIQVIKSTVGGTKVKLSQKKLREKLHLPNSGAELGRLPIKNLDWNIIGISRQIPSGPAKKADLNNDYKLKKRKTTSPSTSGNVNPDELKEKEPAEETSAHNQSPQQLEEEAHQVHSLPTPSPQPQTDDVDNQFWQLYYDWRAWKVGNLAEQLLGWDQKLKNEKIIKKFLGLLVNHSCEQILDDAWVWKRNYVDLHLEHLATTPVSEFEVDDEDPAVYKPVFSKATEDQVVLTSEAQADLEATAEDFQIFSETSSAFETVLPEALQENAVSTPQKQNQEASDEELQQHLKSQVLENLTTAYEQAVEAQRNSAEAEKEDQMEELEASKTPVAVFEEQNEAEERDSLYRDISNFILDEGEGESERTLRIADEEDVQEDAESLPMQLFQRTPSSHQTYASDSYLQLKEVNKIKEQIANVTVSLQKQMSLLQMDIRSALAVSSANQRSNPENSTRHLSSSGLDGTEAVGTIAAHFSNDNQTEERRNNIRRIKELCGNMQGISEIAGSSKRKKH
ncbi:unnamed protein product [Cuscuta campestris]|uniref:Integrase catalytic domain-containing protein n=1 Tax=Cuscuta campestris TaxID=132261 RepID=A0A484L199_9ASTE|nr:unnamed protein product [Cuscuta campestris]